eukprot:3333363-Heterocapsa_arctica.AAC.1
MGAQQDIHLQMVRGKNGHGPLIVSNVGSAQTKDILKLAEETWGVLWAVEAEELPKFSRQKMPPDCRGRGQKGCEQSCGWES